MTTSVERRLIDACDQFVAARDRFIIEVLRAARDASIEALERTFALALATRPRFASAVNGDASPIPDVATSSAPTGDASPTADSTPLPAPTGNPLGIGDADRVLACVRQAPGSHIGQLSQSLAMPASMIRRHLRQLAANDAIRIETARGSGGGQRHQTFFPRDSGNVGTESTVRPAEASA